MRTRFPALKAAVEYLGWKPAFRNQRTHGRTFKWVLMSNRDYEGLKQLVEERFPECAVKRCSLEGILLWIPREHATATHRDRWLKAPTGSSYIETFREVLAASCVRHR